ncbi:DUF4352 domain-containing protein [Actinopolyspora erythraea]|uniref:DUF4352 domain-containing protein n=1 Tax=Actinopolyspora erythraea TaxID=414996 RepID=A0A099D5S1_9ACTN|nr:DUF4352 domain-containing protein [Actinopolyspora erythraea]ASU78951.1 DUF4352 domain-containing protein [Actinopolyspora erythraea]KGI81286.1 hypothetical protein IL38_12470 [Actinopolyspora erythraea]
MSRNTANRNTERDAELGRPPRFMAVAAALLAVAVLGGCATGGESAGPERSGTDSASTGVENAADAAGQPTRLSFGETHTWNGGEAISIAEPSAYTPENEFLRATEGQRYVAFDVTVTNKGDDEYNVASTKFTVQHDGHAAQRNYAAGDTLADVRLPPGGDTTFIHVYQIGESTGELQVSAQPNAFAAETVYFSGNF